MWDPQNKNQNVWLRQGFSVSRVTESWKLRSCALIQDTSSLLTWNETPNSHRYSKSFLLDQSPELTTLTRTWCSHGFSLKAPTSDLWDKPSSLTFNKNPERISSSGEHAKKLLHHSHLTAEGEYLWACAKFGLFFPSNFFKGPKSQPGTRTEIFLPL